jgi:hypothetical protein
LALVLPKLTAYGNMWGVHPSETKSFTRPHFAGSCPPWHAFGSSRPWSQHMSCSPGGALVAINSGIADVCETSGLALTTDAECAAAATALGLSYRGTISASYAPNGCYDYDGAATAYHGLYLNTDAGSATGTTDQCATGVIELG